MMSVINKIQIYEIDDKDVDIKRQEFLRVESHWNYHDFVVIKYDDKSITVNKEDLINAVVNASNW